MARRTYRRRATRRRRSAVKQRVYNRRLPYMSFVKYRPSMLSLTRTFDKTAIGGLTGAPDQLGSFSFTLSEIPGTTELQNLFDRYCVRGIAFRWTLRFNPDIVGTTLGSNVRVYDAIDVTGGTAPTTLNDLRQYTGVRETVLSSSRTNSSWRFFRPKALIANTFSVLKWIPTAVPAQPHFGIQYCVNNLAQNAVVIPEFKMYLQLKNVV